MTLTTYATVRAGDIVGENGPQIVERIAQTRGQLMVIVRHPETGVGRQLHRRLDEYVVKMALKDVLN